MICGIEYSTENINDERPVKFFPDRLIDRAKAWRDEIGPGGNGPAFSSTNGHRIVRSLYKMPTGWRRPKNCKAGSVSFIGELI